MPAFYFNVAKQCPEQCCSEKSHYSLKILLGTLILCWEDKYMGLECRALTILAVSLTLEQSFVKDPVPYSGFGPCSRVMACGKGIW